MEKKRSLVLILVGIILGLSAGPCLAQDDVNKYMSCMKCGMNRSMFAHSRMLITYNDNTVVGTCSLHCAAVDMAANIDKNPKLVEVGDYSTKKLINAREAYWVIGGGKPGVMTKRAKWAFESKSDAEMFIKENGGNLLTFEDVMKSSYEDMYSDTGMIREKRMMKNMKMSQ